MKKLIALLLAVLMVAACVGCASKPTDSKQNTTDDKQTTDNTEAQKPADEQHRAAFITSTARGNEFIDLIWDGFLDLEKEGWEVKCIECFETAEQAEQIYSMCEEGYDLIYSNGDDIKKAIEDLGSELNDAYPNVHFFFLDTYEDPQIDNATSVTIDPFEACFIAGYLAAMVTEKETIGIMMPLDDAIMARFENGYYAGIEYANREEGLNKKWVKAYTNSWSDTTKGYEAAVAMNSNYDIDLIIHCAYISGYGVISACSDLGLKCIGVDGWQGYVDPCVFWSAIKSMNVAVLKPAHAWEHGEELPMHLEYSVKDGGEAYYEPDLENLSPELQEKVVALRDKIVSGEVDVFSNGYEEYRVTSNN